MFVCTADTLVLRDKRLTCIPVLISEWTVTPAASRQFQSGKTQSSSLFDVSSLPWSQHKSLSPGLFGAGDDSLVYKPGEGLAFLQKRYILVCKIYFFVVLWFYLCGHILAYPSGFFAFIS